MKTQNKSKINFAVGVIFTLTVLLLGPAVPVAEAALTAVGPVLDPVNNGYPSWYSDENGLALQLCLDQGALGLCVLTPNFDPLDPALPNPATPIGTVASGNFPDESFYFIADAILDPGVRLPGANTDIKITYRAALEQAFLSGITPNTQQIFLRVQADLNGLQPNSTYTVTHPYGTFDVTTDATGGGRGRFEDMGGCLAPGLCFFDVILPATQTNVGAFLKWDNTLPAPPAGFIGDPNVLHTISGGRGGFNQFIVTGPDVGGLGVNSMNTNLFAVAGQLADTIAPVITMTGVNPVAVRQGSVYTDTGATALDNFDGDITARIVVTGLPVDTNTVGAHTVTYTVSDRAGNTTVATRTVNVEAPVPTTVNIAPANPTIQTGTNQQFTAEILDQFGIVITGTVTWSSSNLVVGVINATGLFNSAAAGATVITATAGTVSGTTNLTIQDPVLTTINITPSALTTSATAQTTFSAATLDQFGNPIAAVVSWSSANPGIGTINAAGLFTAVAPGTVNITGSSGAVATAVSVTVQPQILTTINVTPATLSAGPAQIQQFTAATLDQLGNAMAGVVTWTSSAPLVGTITAGGLFSAVGEGTTVITATSGAISGTATVVVGPLALTTINVTPNPVTITTLSQQFTAATLDQLGDPFPGTVTWSSNNPAVGTINPATGLFTVTGSGTVTITATSGAVSGTAAATVEATLTAINVTPATITINATENTTFTATALDQFSNPMTTIIAWTSSAPLVGTINASGVFTGLTGGTATITAASGAISGTATVTVMPLVLTTINVTPATNSLIITQTRQFSAATLDQLGGAIAGVVTWTSSAPLVGTIDAAGLFTALAEGTATITATSGTVSGTATVTVGPLAATTINVTPATATITGGTQQFTAAATDQLGNPFATAFTWTSSNTAVGTIDASGLFTALSAGTVTITAGAGTASGTASATVQATLTTISVAPASRFVVINHTGALTATALDQFSNPMAPVITWTSSAPLVATVDANGLVTGVALGTTTVTAANGLISGTSLITVVDIPLSITLNAPGQWTLFSAPRQLSAINIISADIDSILRFDGASQQFVQVTNSSDPLLKDPLTSFFVKPNKTTVIDFTLAAQPDPGFVSKALSNGWNLVSTNNPGLAENEFSSIQVTNQVNGIVTLHVPQIFNARKDMFADWGTNANIDLNANPIAGLPDMSLSEVDGYWINMNGAETLSKINQ